MIGMSYVSFWVDEEQKKKLKENARKENRSVGNLIKMKCDLFKEKNDNRN